MKTVKASELVFISRIKMDGSGVELLNEKKSDALSKAQYFDDKLKLTPLSITNGTYIASGFNSYVVKYKQSTIVENERNQIYTGSVGSQKLRNKGSNKRWGG